MARLTVLFFFLFYSFAYAYAQEFVLIVNREGPLVNAGMSEVKDIYLGEKRFADGVELAPVNLDDVVLLPGFLEEVLGMSPQDYKKHWIRKVFREGARMPVTVSSIFEAVGFVARNRGGLAYVPASWAEELKEAGEVVVIDP